jgi:hypothetical protein
MGVRGSLKAGLYRLHQKVWCARARRRYRRDFERVERFCLFIGYPRSGHSIVGALVNAHRDAVIAHELIAPELVLQGCSRDELYARILGRARWFNRRGNKGNYDYQVPGQWQGRFQTLRVLGDKRGGTLAQRVGEHPDLLQRFRSLVGVPLRLVHVIRNPFDNIAAISTWDRLSLPESIEFYFQHCQTTGQLGTLCTPEEVHTVYHEEMIRAPAPVLAKLCAYLGLECYPNYLEDCCSIVFPKPTCTRRKVKWTPVLVQEVTKRVRDYPFLDGYEFEIPEEEAGA